MKPVETKPFKKIPVTLSLMVLITVVAFCSYGYFFIILSQTRQSVGELTNNISVLESEQSETDQIQKQLSDVDARHTVLASYFVDVNDPVPFEEAIEGYGKQTNVQVSFQGLQVNTAPNSLVTSFSTQGTFANTYRFLALVESAPYELSIDTIGLQSAGPVAPNPAVKASTAANVWNTNISLSIYSVTGIK